MATKLVCTVPFASYARGDEITDADAMAQALADNPKHVVRVAAPDPEPAKPAKAKTAPDAA